MKEQVSLRVCGVQRSAGSEETTELRCEGVLKRTADGWLLAYEEPESAGERVSALLRCDSSRVTLTRRGTVRSEMVFAVGERSSAVYALPAGSFTLELETDCIRSSLPAALELDYRLVHGGETLSEHRLRFLLEAKP